MHEQSKWTRITQSRSHNYLKQWLNNLFTYLQKWNANKILKKSTNIEAREFSQTLDNNATTNNYELTLVAALTFAPLLRRCATMSMCPSLDAKCKPVKPCCKKMQITVMPHISEWNYLLLISWKHFEEFS